MTSEGGGNDDYSTPPPHRSSRRTTTTRPRVSALNDNDVLAGRGMGSTQYVGSKRFRTLVDDRAEDYTSTSSYKAKRTIALEVYNEITVVRGGRFLTMEQHDRNNDGRNNNNKKMPVKNVVTEGVWYQMTKAEALEKCKQALRDQGFDETKKKKRGTAKRSVVKEMNDTEKASTYPRGDDDEETTTTILSQLGGSPAAANRLNDNRVAIMAGVASREASPGDNDNTRLGKTSDGSGVIQKMWSSFVEPSSVSATNALAEGPLSPQDASSSPLCLSSIQPPPQVVADQQIPMMGTLFPIDLVRPIREKCNNYLMQQQTSTAPVTPTTTQQGPRDDDNAPFPFHSPTLDSWPGPSLELTSFAQPLMTTPVQRTVADAQLDTILPTALEQDRGTSGAQVADEMDALAGLSALPVSALPTFTEQQEAIERATMTDEERAEVLSDAFGRYCNVDVPRSNKRPRRDLDRHSIQFLIRQTRVELELIPEANKRALLDAQFKCEAFEFSDDRLESFLRSVGMNTRLAALRFVKYWEERRRLFGQDKYWMRMTLSEALRDDLDAIQDGVICLLPYPDSSGRQIVVLEPHRRTVGKYSSESLLRAFWYVMEVVALENTDINRGYVGIGWHKSTTIWDYDHRLYDRFISFERNCWPVRIIASHICCPSNAFLNVLRPILSALTERRIRARTHWHDVPDCDLVDTLWNYGITKDVLPIEMGGTISFSQSQWMADRLTAELHVARGNLIPGYHARRSPYHHM